MEKADTKIPTEAERTGLTEPQEVEAPVIGEGGSEMRGLAKLYSEQLDPQVLTPLGHNHTVPSPLARMHQASCWRNRRESRGGHQAENGGQNRESRSPADLAIRTPRGIRKSFSEEMEWPQFEETGSLPAAPQGSPAVNEP